MALGPTDAVAVNAVDEVPKEEPSEMGDAGKVQTLASTIIRYLTRSAEVKAAGDVYISPVDPDIRIPLSVVSQKAVLEDPVAAAWKEIQSIASAH